MKQSGSPEEVDRRDRRFAEIYVFEKTGNKVQSYIQLLKELGIESNANYESKCKYAVEKFRKPSVQKYVREFQIEAQKKFDVRKEEIVITLQNIAFDESNTMKNRLAALKQLTDIGGFAQQNVNLNADTKLEVVIE